MDILPYHALCWWRFRFLSVSCTLFGFSGNEISMHFVVHFFCVSPRPMVRNCSTASWYGPVLFLYFLGFGSAEMETFGCRSGDHSVVASLFFAFKSR